MLRNPPAATLLACCCCCGYLVLAVAASASAATTEAGDGAHSEPPPSAESPAQAAAPAAPAAPAAAPSSAGPPPAADSAAAGSDASGVAVPSDVTSSGSARQAAASLADARFAPSEAGSRSSAVSGRSISAGPRSWNSAAPAPPPPAPPAPSADAGQFHIQTDEGPERYFRYQTQSGQYRKEKRLQDGSVVGSYGWIGADGVLRLRDYVADNSGYRVVRTKSVYVGRDEPIGSALAKSKSAPSQGGTGYRAPIATAPPTPAPLPLSTPQQEPAARAGLLGARLQLQPPGVGGVPRLPAHRLQRHTAAVLRPAQQLPVPDGVPAGSRPLRLRGWRLLPEHRATSCAGADSVPAIRRHRHHAERIQVLPAAAVPGGGDAVAGPASGQLRLHRPVRHPPRHLLQHRPGDGLRPPQEQPIRRLRRDALRPPLLKAPPALVARLEIWPSSATHSLFITAFIHALVKTKHLQLWRHYSRDFPSLYSVCCLFLVVRK